MSEIRVGLDTSCLSSLTLGVASSCDLKHFVDSVCSDGYFKEVRYNFSEGSSDDASIEIMRPEGFLHSSDVIVASVAQSVKKLIHPIARGDRDVDCADIFAAIVQRLNAVVKFMGMNAKCGFLFKYPIKRFKVDLDEEVTTVGTLGYWLNELDQACLLAVREHGNGQVMLLDLDEALVDTGQDSRYLVPEVFGGHPAARGGRMLCNLFTEKCIARLDKTGKVKAIALDLDNTLWNGTYLESVEKPKLNKRRVAALNRHITKGIPIAIVSKNNPEDVDDIKAYICSCAPGLARGIVSYYVGWGAKSESLRKMTKSLNIGLDGIAFFDDNKFEREEVRYSLPDVRIYEDVEIEKSRFYAEFSFPNLSEGARSRVQSYHDNVKRQTSDESRDQATNLDDYLRSLDFRISFSNASVGDLDRIDELVQRTNQQNLLLARTPRAELAGYIDSKQAVVISLKDRFGDYGVIGTIIFNRGQADTRLIELAISCRALGKGVEEAIIAFLQRHVANQDGLSFVAEITYKNRAFFDKLLSVGFKYDDTTAIMQIAALLSAPYPSWFSVETNVSSEAGTCGDPDSISNAA